MMAKYAKGFTVKEGDDVLLGGLVGQAPQPDNVVAVVQVFDGVAGLLQRPVHLAFLGLKNWKQKMAVVKMTSSPSQAIGSDYI